MGKNYSKIGAPEGHRLIEGGDIEEIQPGFYESRGGNLLFAKYESNRLVIFLLPDNPAGSDIAGSECMLNYATYLSNDEVSKLIEDKEAIHKKAEQIKASK